MNQTAVPSIDTAYGTPPQSTLQTMLSHQAFWVTIAVFLIPLAMTLLDNTVWANGFTRAFWKDENFFNITRNFAFIAIMALGQVAVMITGGIDLAVGSTLAVTGIVLGLLMESGFSFWTAALAALVTGVAIGLINGYLIAYLQLSPFVVTLGMLSIGRSLALAISDNKFFHKFGWDRRATSGLGRRRQNVRRRQSGHRAWWCWR